MKLFAIATLYSSMDHERSAHLARVVVGTDTQTSLRVLGATLFTAYIIFRITRWFMPTISAPVIVGSCIIIAIIYSYYNNGILMAICINTLLTFSYLFGTYGADPRLYGAFEQALAISIGVGVVAGVIGYTLGRLGARLTSTTG